MRTLADTTDLVGHTLIVREQAEILLSLLKDAETGQRGFVITGDPEYLDPYENARKLLPTYQARLHELTRDNPAQQVALPRLDALIEARLSRLQEGIRVRREDGFEAAARFVIGDEGKRLMDSARDVAASVLDEERRLYELRVGQLAGDSRAATVTNITGLVLAGALLLGATMLLAVASRQREAERAARRVADAVAGATRESEHRLRITLTSIGDGVIAIDDKGRVTLINPVAQALTGGRRRVPRAEPWKRSSGSSTRRRGSRWRTRSLECCARAASWASPTTRSSSRATGARLPSMTVRPPSPRWKGGCSGSSWCSGT
jgi:CHASE3 domain sensor protein